MSFFSNILASGAGQTANPIGIDMAGIQRAAAVEQAQQPFVFGDYAGQGGGALPAPAAPAQLPVSGPMAYATPASSFDNSLARIMQLDQAPSLAGRPVPAEPRLSYDMTGMGARAPAVAKSKRTFWDTLGDIGDVLAMMDGRAPIFRQRRADKAFSSFLANPSDQQAQADFIARDPTRAYAFQQQQREAALAREKMLRGASEPTNTERTYDFLTRRLGANQADGYLRSIAMGPPVAVDQVDPVTKRTVRGFYTRGELYGGNGTTGGQQGAPQSAPAQSSGDPSTIIANAVSSGSISPENYAVLGRHWNAADMKRIDAYLRNNRVVRSGAAPASTAPLPSGFVLD